MGKKLPAAGAPVRGPGSVCASRGVIARLPMRNKRARRSNGDGSFCTSVQGETHFGFRRGGVTTGGAVDGLSCSARLRAGEKSRCRACRERNSTVGAETHWDFFPQARKEDRTLLRTVGRIKDSVNGPVVHSRTWNLRANDALLEGLRREHGQRQKQPAGVPAQLELGHYLAKK